MTEFTRRRLLAATAGIASAGAVAGCLDGAADGGNGPNSDGTTAQSSFFVFGDFAAEVAGETATSEVLVPIGQHGHGWEPGPRVRESIRDGDLFVHGMEGFQPWADDILQDLDADNEDVATVDVSEGLHLLETGEGHDEHEDEHDEHDEHDEDEHEEEGHDEEEHQDEHGDGMDPHFWTDPLRASEAVDNVRQALTEVDDANADQYADNAAEYQDRLDDLHDRIESITHDASNDVILLAGHDAFQYFGERYGVQIEALTDVSPDDQPTPRSIERAQNVIQDHDLQYICADPLESQEAAEQLVAETDAEAILPLTSLPGRNREWADEGWGYVEIMENVNLPTLERALDV